MSAAHAHALAHPGPAAVLESQVLGFLAGCRDPAISERREELLSLVPGRYLIEERRGCLRIEAWDDARTLSRRILGVVSRSRGRLDLVVERFGKRPGSLMLFDRAVPSNHSMDQRGARQGFAGRFQRMLWRQFPGWRVAALSSEPDLQHSLSPVYPRALLVRGNQALAAIAAPEDALRVDGVLSFGLIWLDYLRQRELRRTVPGLAVFVPEGHEKVTCLRIRHLEPDAARFSVYSYSSRSDQLLDLADFGNVDTQLEGPRDAAIANGPEAELERQIRANLEVLDARLLPAPSYRQAITLAAGQRGILDLLAADRHGRLTIVEVKASEDIHLPLQALDYWIHVKWHLDRKEFGAKGYFPGIELRSDAPRLLLVAPALEFHPTNETVLRFFPRSIEVERLGVGNHWTREPHKPRVMFRM